MLLAFVDDNARRIILWVVIIGSALGLISLLVHTMLVSRRNKKIQGEQTAAANDENADNAPVEQDERLDAATADNIVMSRNVIYSVGLDGQMRSGKYTLTNADNSADKFNVRVNGLVREYANGDTVALANGDTISPVSGSVVLSKAE